MSCWCPLTKYGSCFYIGLIMVPYGASMIAIQIIVFVSICLIAMYFV